MRLIFIRHAEPDYINNTLTEKGFREAEILAKRIKDWKVDQFYASPLPRAQLTLAPAIKERGKNEEVIIKDWLQEFSYMIEDPLTGETHVPWDFMPEWWTKREKFYDKENWFEEDIFQQNPAYVPAVKAMREGLDEILSDFGYTRNGWEYLTDDEIVTDDDDTTLVFGAHLGANCEAIGYLLGISPVVLQQSIFMAPTSITVLNAEKRRPGHAQFRAQFIADASHLTQAKEPLSHHGVFSEIFMQ